MGDWLQNVRLLTVGSLFFLAAGIFVAIYLPSLDQQAYTPTALAHPWQWSLSAPWTPCPTKCLYWWGLRGSGGTNKLPYKVDINPLIRSQLVCTHHNTLI